MLDIQDVEYIHLSASYIPQTFTSEVIFNELVPTEIRSVQISRKLDKKQEFNIYLNFARGKILC